MLTGSDYTSRVGTKACALKSSPEEYLANFGKCAGDMNGAFAKAEQFLIQTLMKNPHFKTMDELRYFKYHQSECALLDNLPPTSFAITEHILRAFYATHLQLNCMTGESLNAVD